MINKYIVGQKVRTTMSTYCTGHIIERVPNEEHPYYYRLNNARSFFRPGLKANEDCFHLAEEHELRAYINLRELLIDMAK